MLVEVVHGKTNKCMQEIKEYLDNGFDRPLIYLVPEQFSFEAEKKLIEVCERKGIIGAQVLSFKRLAYKVFSFYNVNINSISNSGKAMLIYFIMTKINKQLNVLKDVQNNIGLVNTVVQEISEFKRYNLSPEMLINLNINNEFLKLKLQDLSLIYSEYQKSIERDYIDTNDELTVLANILDRESTFLDGAKIWIDEFDGFVPQELSVIKALSKRSDITISMITGDEDYFSLNNLNFEKLQKLNNDRIHMNSSNFEKCEQDNNIIKLDNVVRFNNDELKHLEKNIYKIPYVKFNDETKNIFINEYQNPYIEIERIANYILHILYESDKNGRPLKYENIAILTRNIDKYKNIIKMIFPLYDIPFFLDDQKDLSMEPLITLILAFIDIVSSNYKYENVFAYLKTGLTNVEDERDIDLLENYVLKWGIKGNKWEEDFKIDDEELEHINSIRNEVITPIIQFKSRFEGRKSVKEIVIALLEFLNSIEVYDRLINKVDKFLHSEEEIRQAQEYTQVWNMLMAIFDEMVESIGEEQISFERFKDVFKIGVSNHKISVIPSVLDKVIIGDIERTRNSEIKVLFVCGVNDGDFPKVFQTEGFINDKEREELLNIGVEIAKDTKKLLLQEYFNIYKALCAPSEKLFISYPISDLEGKALRQAYIINKLKSVFPKISPAEEVEFIHQVGSFPDLLCKIRSKKDGEQNIGIWEYVEKWYLEYEKDKINSVLKGLDYKNTIEFNSKELPKKMYGENMNTSVSRLEKFVNCPFSFYLKYGLNLKERKIYSLETPDIGSFMHDVIDKFSKKVLDDGIDLRTISKEECELIGNNITNDLLTDFRNNLFNSTGKLRTIGNKLKVQVKKVLWLIVCQLRSGSFEMLGSEIEFGKGKEYPEIVIELSEDEKLTLSRKGR